MSTAPDIEAQIADDIGTYYADPLGFVRYAWPWGEPGPLADDTGPDDWQTDILETLGAALQRGLDPDAERTAIQVAVASGNGVGKSALVSWIIYWWVSTRPDCQCIVTANTAPQLSGKTWREVAKWHRHAINAHWFTWTATKLYAKAAPSTWFASAVPWSKNNPEAFAGTHEKEVLLVFDESSGIEDIIWETASGALTTPGAAWLAFGNPTRNSGRFRECFGKRRHRWHTRHVDGRDAKMTNKAELANWVADEGEDSDYIRVHVKGEFPRVGDVQLISSARVEAAQTRDLEPRVFAHYPRFVGVDVARFGDDQSVILRRQGPMVWHPQTYRRIDTMQLAGHVLDATRDFETNTVFVDGVGVGGGVVDRLREMSLDVIDVQSGEQATDHKRFKNRRIELWWRLKEWLDGDVSLPGIPQLRDDLIGPEYGFDASMRMQLESVQSMKDRGMASPDLASALALTFADFTVNRRAKAQTIQHKKWA